MTKYQQPFRKAVSGGGIARLDRGGAVTLEFLLVFPVLLIVLLATIEFGMLLANQQQVALACRVGAEEASQTDLGSSDTGDPIPANILQAIDAQLQSSGISACRIYLQHNVSAPDQELVQDYVPSCDCSAPVTPLPTPPTYGRLSVRVTVCVPMAELAPNCLVLFGFDLADRCIRCSTTFRYEG